MALLAGQKALVTGANTGIGKAIALALGKAGADVVVNYLHDDKAAAAAVAEIQAGGVKAFAHRADVGSEQDVTALFDQTMREFGTLNILVPNAGIQMDASFADMTLTQWDTVLKVNLTGQFLCARAAVREFLRRGVQPEVSRAAGKIICISSVHQVIPWAGHVNYAASKGGVKLMMESMAQELAPQKIRVNAIAPGAIRTSINTAAWDSEAAMKGLLKLMPYGRIASRTTSARRRCGSPPTSPTMSPAPPCSWMAA